MKSRPRQSLKIEIGGQIVELPRRVEVQFHLDANLINAKQKHPEINRLERWAKDGVIMMELSATAHKEAAPNPRSSRASKVNEYIFAIPADWKRDLPLLTEIGIIIFGERGPVTVGQRRDVLIVYTAAHYNAILVTADGESKRQPRGLLGSRADLWEKKRIRVMSATQAVEHVEKLIEDRDNTITRVCRDRNLPVPDWVGAD